MNTISITTTQNIELDFELASLGDRVIGRILDFIILLAYSLIVLAIIGFGRMEFFIDRHGWLMIFLIGFPWVFYDLLSEIVFNGVSVGKKVMGVKIISLNAGQPGLGQYLIRWLFRIVDFTIFGGLIAFIMVAATEKKQRVGDLVAGTVVVKVKSRTQISDTIYSGAYAENYQVGYPEVINLKDSDVQLIKDILRSVYSSGNTILSNQAQQKIEQVLGIQNREADAASFLKIILLDYNYLTSKL